MLLQEFVEDLSIRLAGEDAIGRENDIAKGSLEAAIADDEFIVDSMSRQIELMRIPPPVRRRRNISYARTPRFSVRLIFWPPGYTVEPHRHGLWTVAGVILNRIGGTIYKSMSELEPIHRFEEAEGAVGMLVPPCVHQFTNPTDEPSVTMNLYGQIPPAPDGDAADGTRDTEPHPRNADTTGLYFVDLKERAEVSIARIVGERPSQRSLELLEAISAEGTPNGAMEARSAAARVEAALAATR